MPLAVTCNSCQARFRVNPELAGKRARCSRCGAVFRIPSAEGASIASAAASTPATSEPLETAPSRPTASQLPSALPIATEGSRAPETGSFVFEAGGEDPRLARLRRRRGIRVPVWAWFTGAGGVLFAALAISLYANRDKLAALRSAAETTPEMPRHASTAQSHRSGYGPGAPRQVRLAKPKAGAVVEDIIAYVSQGIVKIEVFDEYGNQDGLGSGFVIDARGWVATNYHVTEDAVKADAVFNDGTRFGVEGYLALEPEADLAILQLNGTPGGMSVLDLHTVGEPRVASKVYAIGHPHGYQFQLTDGIVSAVQRTSQLPQEAQDFLREGLTDKFDNVWISHTARISPGNSGGPLLNAAGQVIGVNSWVSPQINLGFAIHARALDALRANVLARPEPLQQHRRQAPDFGQLADRKQIELAVGGITRLGELAAARQWATATDADYDSLRQLALAITYVAYLKAHPERAEPALAAQLETLEREAQGVCQSLTEAAWDRQRQIRPANRHALEALEVGMEGIALFGTVERILQTSDRAQRGILLTLVDEDRHVFLPLSEAQRDFQPSPGSRFLILGIAYGSELRFGDNPLEPRKAALVLSRSFIPVEF